LYPKYNNQTQDAYNVQIHPDDNLAYQ
jgi:hypothetical protein